MISLIFAQYLESSACPLNNVHTNPGRKVQKGRMSVLNYLIEVKTSDWKVHAHSVIHSQSRASTLTCRAHMQAFTWRKKSIDSSQNTSATSNISVCLSIFFFFFMLVHASARVFSLRVRHLTIVQGRECCYSSCHWLLRSYLTYTVYMPTHRPLPTY